MVEELGPAELAFEFAELDGCLLVSLEGSSSG